MNILNEQELIEVRKFLENEVQMEAVRKVLLGGIYYNGTLKPGEASDPSRNFALSLVAQRGQASNEELGQDLRACSQGIILLETAFQKLLTYKEKEEPKEKEKNQAR